MKKDEILAQLTLLGAVAVIRMSDSENLKRVSEAIHKGGVSAIEITMTTPNALAVIENLSKTMGNDIIVGVGSVLDSQSAISAINAGARFVVSPIFKPDIVETVKKLGILVMPGAFTPTEILSAFEYGADIVKVFPADVVGMSFFKSVLAPMPHLKLMPTGGVTLTNAGDWLKAGACAVGVGTALLDKKAISENNFAQLTENAKILCRSIAEGRN
jgi:2-dehydro-3-deoxyphosphogluconate aldolase/(4S)-4-hydroxy-2-oxoglutarate aldolase